MGWHKVELVCKRQPAQHSALTPANHGDTLDGVTAIAPVSSTAAPTAKVLLSMTTSRGQARGNSPTLLSPHKTMQNNDTSRTMSHMNRARMEMLMRAKVPP